MALIGLPDTLIGVLEKTETGDLVLPADATEEQKKAYESFVKCIDDSMDSIFEEI